MAKTAVEQFAETFLTNQSLQRDILPSIAELLNDAVASAKMFGFSFDATEIAQFVHSVISDPSNEASRAIAHGMLTKAGMGARTAMNFRRWATRRLTVG